MFRIFDFSDERTFAAKLVGQIVNQLPPAAFGEEAAGNLSVNKITRLLERIYRETEKHFQHKKLGVIRRSVFANTFKWGLSEKGYSAKFIDLATEGLIMEMAKVKK